MAGNNVLTGGVEILEELKQSLVQLNNMENECKQWDQKENQLEASIHSKENQIEEEVNQVVKKRKEDVLSNYDAQIEKTVSRLKKVRAKKEKQKSAKISEKIELNTSDLREENSHLKLEAKTKLRQNKAPAFMNTRLFFILYSPRGIQDIFGSVLILVIALLVIPGGIYILLPKQKDIYLAIIYIIDILAFGGLYIWIYQLTKDKHKEVLKDIKLLYKKVGQNEKEINAIKKEILKDKDESGFGLDDFVNEITELEEQLKDLEGQKKDGTLTFENTTKNIIAGEIKEKYIEEMTSLNDEYNQAHYESANFDNKAKELAIIIGNEYGAFLGNEFLNLDKVEALITLMEKPEISTVSQAIKAYNEQSQHAV